MRALGNYVLHGARAIRVDCRQVIWLVRWYRDVAVRWSCTRRYPAHWLLQSTSPGSAKFATLAAPQGRWGEGHGRRPKERGGSAA